MASLSLDDIPWDRVIQFHGRASNIPKAIRALDSPNRERRRAAIEELRQSLEHQDGVIQATPLAVPFLIAALEKSNDPTTAGELRDLIAILFEAAAFQLENDEPPTPRPRLEDLISEEKLWPPFQSEEEDEALFEEPDVADDLPAWAWLTVEQIRSAGIDGISNQW